MLCPYCGIYNPTGTQICNNCRKDMTIDPPPEERADTEKAFSITSFSARGKKRKSSGIPFIDSLRDRYAQLPGDEKAKVAMAALGVILLLVIFGVVGACTSLDLCSKCSAAIESCGKEEEVVVEKEKIYLALGLVGQEPEVANYSSFYGYWDLKDDATDSICFNPNLTFVRSDGRSGTYEYITSTQRLYLYYNDEAKSVEYFSVWFANDYLMLGYDIKTYARGLLGEGFEGTWKTEQGDTLVLRPGETWGMAGDPDKLGYFAASWRYDDIFFYYTDYGNMLVTTSNSDIALVSGTDITKATESCYAFSIDGDTLRLITATMYKRRQPIPAPVSGSDVSSADLSPTDLSQTDLSATDKPAQR